MQRSGVLLAPIAMLVWLELSAAASAASISTYWDNIALDYVQRTNPGPQASVRTLAIMHAAMYDAWTAHDPLAVPTRRNRILKRPPEEMSDANKLEAISFAAHKALVGLFPSMASGIDSALTELGYDLEDVGSSDTSAPPGIGNVAAEAVINSRDAGGSQLFDAFAKAQGLPVLTPGSVDAPNAWRPVRAANGSAEFVFQQGSAR